MECGHSQGQLMELDFQRGYHAAQLMDGESPDREYLWEGDDLMFEDIVASTQPLYYNPAFLRKYDYQLFPAEESEIEEDEQMFAEEEPPVVVA